MKFEDIRYKPQSNFNLRLSTLQFAIYLINQMKERSAQKSLKMKILGFLSIPLLRLFPPKPKDLQIGDLNWEDEQICQSSHEPLDSHEKLSLKQPFQPFKFQEKYPPLFDVKIVSDSNLSNLVMDPSMIGIIGDQQSLGLQYLESVQIIRIDPTSQIPTLNCIRPYSFSNIFVTNEFTQFPQQLLFRCQQTFSIKIKHLHHLNPILRQRQAQIIKDHHMTPIKNIIEKLKIKLCQGEGGFWLVLNCCEGQPDVESYLCSKLDLDPKNDQQLLQRICSSITVEELVEFIKLKENESSLSCRKAMQKKINFKLNRLISQTQETLMKSQQVLSDRYQLEQSSNSDMFSSPRQELQYDIQPLSPISQRKRSRSRSADLSEEIFMKEIQERQTKMWEQLLHIN